MRHLLLARLPQRRPYSCTSKWLSKSSSIIDINSATFYKQYPSQDSTDTNAARNPPIFPKLVFALPANSEPSGVKEYWSILSSSSLARTTFLQVLKGQFVCLPPTARSYPFLASPAITDPRLRSPNSAIKYVGFDAERGGFGGTSLKGAYLSARYESRKEETDFTLHDYLTGNTELNALEHDDDSMDRSLLARVIGDLKLSELMDRPVNILSNGQTRRARIAKSLMTRPELLLLDGPFMGLDPPTVRMISSLLHELAERSAPRLVLSLRPEDHIPDWISHLVLVDESLQVLGKGKKVEMLKGMATKGTASMSSMVAANQPETLSRDGFPMASVEPATLGEAVVEMNGVKVAYGDKTVLGDWQQTDEVSKHSQHGLQWTVKRGQRWGIFGPNGSGKTTLLSLITSDHPQTYSLPIKLFGRSRIPTAGERGISIFELQRRIGHSSPEVHTFFPKHLSVRRVLESAWSDAPLSRPQLDDLARRKVDACLRWFGPDINPSPNKSSTIYHQLDAQSQSSSSTDFSAELTKVLEEKEDLAWTTTTRFSDLPFSTQRLALFLRAIVAGQELVILDEAFSGMDEVTRDKALLFLSHGETLTHTTSPPSPGHDSRKGQTKKSLLAQQRKDSIAMTGLTENQALLVISHSKEDVPGCVRSWICLPEPGEGRAARWGTLQGPLELNEEGWQDIWGR